MRSLLRSCNPGKASSQPCGSGTASQRQCACALSSMRRISPHGHRLLACRPRRPMRCLPCSRERPCLMKSGTSWVRLFTTHPSVRCAQTDIVACSPGDKSTDMSWYTKRATLGAVYSATELFMITDTSPEFADTWAFLDRRIADVMQMGKSIGQMTEAASAWLANSRVTKTTTK